MVPAPPGVIIGAGISGLAAARALQELGHAPEILEAAPEVGGLTRSTTVGGFSFDYTGHLLHLSHHDKPSDLPFSLLLDDEWQQVSRRSYCYVGGALVPAPIQYHLGDLPAGLREAAIASYRDRPANSPSGNRSFDDHLVSGFGDYLARLFLIPQNEKTLATSLGRLAPDAFGRFFPRPDDVKVRAGMTPGVTGPVEYNSRFWYPKRGGISRLVEGLARGVSNVRLGEAVASLDLNARSLRTTSGREIRWQFLLSSIPLIDLCRVSGHPELERLAVHLSHSSTVCVNLGVRGQLGPGMGDAQWIYVPDKSLPFYRVGAYSQISDGVCPVGHSSIYAEVGFAPEEAKRPDLVADVEERVERALVELEWIPRNAVVCRVSHLIRCAYVHFTPERERTVPAILDILGRYRVFPIGWYGTWDYTSMEDSIMSGIDTARQVAA
jgi:protoporphyrinogen oxidase